MLSLHICHEQGCVCARVCEWGGRGGHGKFKEEEEALSEGIPFVWLSLCVRVCKVQRMLFWLHEYLILQFQ